MNPGFSYFGVHNQQDMAQTSQRTDGTFFPDTFGLRSGASAPGLVPRPGVNYPGFNYFGVHNQQKMAQTNQKAGGAFFPGAFAGAAAPGLVPPGTMKAARPFVPRPEPGKMNPAVQPFSPGKR